MKRLLTFIVISILIFNWIGYQLYTSITDQYPNQNLSANIDQRDLRESGPNAGKMPTFCVSFFAKDVDFDDLFEFTSTPNYSVNEIFFNLSNDLFLNHANKENQPASFKCFNGEYYSTADKLFTKYPEFYSSGKIPDRYLLNIPIIFLGLKDHPPQYFG